MKIDSFCLSTVYYFQQNKVIASKKSFAIANDKYFIYIFVWNPIGFVFLRYFIIIIEAFALNLVFKNWYFLNTRDDKCKCSRHTAWAHLFVCGYTSTLKTIS
jgi:hypothetical protein